MLLGALSAPVLAAQLRQLRLADGSVISGEIESIHDGIYTVTSPSLGTITVKDSEIRSIETPSGSPDQTDAMANAPSAASNPQVDAAQRRILGDDALMSLVSALENDPQLQDVLQDPAIMDAIRAGNLDALEQNAKVQRLMDNPKIQEINKKLAE